MTGLNRFGVARHQAECIHPLRAKARRSMARPLPFTLLATSLMSVVMVAASMPQLHAASRNAFPGRRIGGGTRGECAARPLVHMVPASSVFAPGDSSLIALLEGPSPDPQPLEVTLRSASADGSVDPAEPPVLQRELPAAVNRLVLITIPAASRPLLWESSYRCGAESGDDEFGFITASAPPALSLLVPEGAVEDQSIRQKLTALKSACGGTTALSRLQAALNLGDGVIDASWPQTITVQCF